jgi:integrase
LTWDCVRWEEGELLISKSLRTDGFNGMNVIWASTKTGPDRIIPMSAPVKQILQQHKASMEALGIYEPHGLVFVTPRTRRSIYNDLIDRRWKQSLQRCGVKHRRLYAQRHPFLSHALAMGNSPADLAQITGHSTDMLLKTYAKPTGRVQIPNWIAA